MKRIVVLVGVLGIVYLASTATQAQEKLKAFDVWLGEWAVEEQGKDISSGEQYRIKGKAHISQLGDHYYVRRFTSENLNVVVVMGHDPVGDSYYSEAFASNGLRSSSTITFGDKKFTDDWTHVTLTGEKIQERCEIDLVATQISFECEVHRDGEWAFSRNGTGTRTK